MKSVSLIGLSRRVEYVLLAIVAFIPTTFLHQGVTNADTKLYLTSNPWKLLTQAQYAWDSSQFGGYVPHQAVGYLWPSGPFYLLLHTLHISPWLIQRLWVGTLFLLAGLGVRWCARHLGLERSGAFVAALVYQVTPFVLAYQSRTSVLLLPWVGLGWICALTLLGIRNPGWRYPAFIALIVFSVGGINATALIMIAPAPVLFIVDALVDRRLQFKRAVALLVRVGILCFGVSLWWIAMIAIQARYGSKVLSYSETLESVSSSGTSAEVIRGMGYWLNYVTKPGTSATTAALRYMTSPLVIFLTLLIPALGILGISLTRLPARRVASWLVLVGTVVAVGVYPLSSSSRLMSKLAEHSTSFLALALRSSTRAYPVLLLGIAIGVGALIQKICLSAVVVHRSMAQLGVVAIASLLVLSTMPSLWTTGVTDPSLAHRQTAPEAWKQAGSFINENSGSTSRVLQIPGQEFGAYNWGFTVDPALATVTNTPIITRDLLPLGEPQVMDLVFSLDDAAQNNTLRTLALLATAKKLGASSVFIPHDIDTSRFLTVDPSAFLDHLDIPDAKSFLVGDSRVSVAKIANSSIARLTDQTTILSGSGSGLVTAAQYGLVNDSLLRYSADMTPQDLSVALQSSPLVLTDSNRLQTRHWRSSIDTLGYSQDDSLALNATSNDASDQRLPIFESPAKNSNTFVSQNGLVTATASAYGTPLSYWPEARPFFALDGDPLTAWTADADADPYGATLYLSAKEPLDRLLLLQPQGNPNRWLNLVVISVDGINWSEIKMTSESRTTGQVVKLASPSRLVYIALIGLDWIKGTQQQNLDGVGFAEVLANQPFTIEETHLPSDAIDLSSPTTPVSVVLSREQASPQRWWRSDPELLLNRSFKLPSRQAYKLDLDASLHADSPEQLTGALLGVTTTASEHAHGSLQHAGWFTTDADLNTSWQSRVGHTTSSWVSFDVKTKTPELTLTQCSASTCNTITGVAISDGSTTINASIQESAKPQTINTSALNPGRWTMTATTTTDRIFIDSRFSKALLYPLEIFEITGEGVTRSVPRLPQDPITVALHIDNAPIQTIASFTGTVIDPIVTMLSSDEISLDAGVHTVKTASYSTSAIAINNLAFVSNQASPIATQANLAMSGKPTRRSAVLPASTTPQWFVFGEGFSRAWNASINGKRISDHIRADGGFNAWLIAPHDQPITIATSFSPQRGARLAQLLTLLTVLGCTLILWRSKKTAVESVGVINPHSVIQTISLKARIVAVALCALLAGLVVDTSSWGGIIALGLVVVIFPWRPLFIMIATVLPIYRIWGAYSHIAESDLAPRFDWPSVSAPSHQVLLHALVVFAILVTLTTPRHQSN